MEDTVDKKKIVEAIRKRIEASKETHIWGDYTNALKLISQVIFTRSSAFILELIQNAEDAGLGLEIPGVFEITINDHRLKIMHNGCPFSADDVEALSGIRSSKKPEKGTLGYLGIGFKSVFKVTDRPEVYSNGFQFKFDRNYADWDDPSSTPWHVMPIWIDEPSEIIDTVKTTFIIPYVDEASYSLLLEEVNNLRTELYLFLRWLKKIEVIDEVSGHTWTLENFGENEEGITTLQHDGQQQTFNFFRRTIEVPDWVKQDRLTAEYRQNVTQREIAIAFALDGEGNLAPSEAGAMYGGVYSFLPLGEARSGAKFPIQADFLVQPGRDAINYEAKWNHWLVKEVASLCKEAIGFFKEHGKWKYQFLPAFEFRKSEGLESYDKLFGPELIGPLETFIEEHNCIPTVDGDWSQPKRVLRLTEDSEASGDLITMGVLKRDEIASVMGGQPDLKLVHPAVEDGSSKLIKKVDRFNLLANISFLEDKRNTADAAVWFRCLYTWLFKHPAYESYIPYRARKPRWRPIQYHKFEFVLTADKTLQKGGDVLLLDLPTSDPIIKSLAHTLQKSRPVLHPDILSGTRDEDEEKDLRGFLTGFAGVQVLDRKKVCREALLPKILTDEPKPPPEDLLKYTIYCEQVLGQEVGNGLEFWILTKRGDVRSAKEVFFPTEFKPEQDWEAHQNHVSGISFITPDYLEGETSTDRLGAWVEFFRAGGVKNAPDNGVEEFAMDYAEQELKRQCKNVRRVEKRNYGYDIEAETQTGDRIQVEVKGQSSERAVELTDNETDAADKYTHNFYLCVVSSIPENPAIHMVRNPAGVGKKDKLTIPVNIWKQCLSTL